MTKIFTLGLLLATFCISVGAAENSKSDSASPDGNTIGVKNTTTVETTLPFSETFDWSDALDKWTIVNHNNDATTWDYVFFEQAIGYSYDPTNPADDYLISPQFDLDATKTYKFAYEARIPFMSMTPESFKVLLIDPDSTNITTIADYPSYTDIDYIQKEHTLTVPTSGKYKIAFYIYSPANNGEQLIIDNVNLSEVVVNEPTTVAALPFSETFDWSDALDKWTIVNHNDDENTWGYMDFYQSAGYLYHMTNQADDYLISPQFNLDDTKVYRFAYEARVPFMSMTPESFKVLLIDPDSTNVTTIADYPSYTDIDYVQKEHILTVPATGKYKIAFYVYSQAATLWRLEIDNVELAEVGTKGAPGDIQNLAIDVADNGLLKDTLSFTAPSQTFEGGTLTDLSKIEIYRLGDDETLIHTIDNPTPGENLKWGDDSPVNGFNSYQVKAYNSNGYGPASEINAYVGVDIPVAIDEVLLENSDEKALLTWEAPLEGTHDGYINPDDLTYRIVRSDGQEIATAISDTSYTDNDPLNGAVQASVSYIVYAASTAGESSGTESGLGVFGTPYAAPYYESFANAEASSGPWASVYIDGDDPQWNIVDFDDSREVEAQDNDGGFMTFNSYDEVEGGMARMVSPKIDISEMGNPILGFWVYHFERSTKDSVQAQISVDGSEFEDVGSAICASSKALGDNWVYYELPLLNYKASEEIVLGFLGISDYGYNVSVDNISIFDGPLYDLSVTNFTGKKRVDFKQNETYTVEIENLGGVTVDDYSVELHYGIDSIQTVQGVEIAPYSQKEYTFSVSTSIKDITEGDSCYAYYANIIYADDEVDTNNVSDTIKVTVRTPALPVPLQLIAEKQDGNEIKLSWTTPEERPQPTFTTVIEDFESYDAFTKTDMGDWTLIDKDLDSTDYINIIEKDYPNRMAPMAYQIFNTDSLNVSDDELFLANSGVQYLFSPTSKHAANDNWFISPMLSSKEQTITFWAKQASDLFEVEKVIIWYSTSDNHVDSFEKLIDEDYWTIDNSYFWKEYSFTLPEGARYFAIQSMAKGSYFLGVDDITFEKTDSDPLAINLQGYNLYRNDTLVVSLNSDDTEYIETLPLGKYSYRLTAVYDKGESAYSNEAYIALSSVEQFALFNAAKIYGDGNNIYVKHAEGKRIDIYSIDGRLLNSYTGQINTVIRNYETGFYVVRVGKLTQKVIIR